MRPDVGSGITSEGKRDRDLVGMGGSVSRQGEVIGSPRLVTCLNFTEHVCNV